MIELSAHTLLLVYLSFTSLVLLFLWIWHDRKEKNRTRLCQREELQLCEYCHFLYLTESDKKVSQCPQCSGWNRPKK